MTRRADRKGRSQGGLGPFVALERYLLDSAAWRFLTPVARAAYVEIAMLYRGDNNGRLVMSCRMLADGLGVSKDTASRALKRLIEVGLIEPVKKGAFSLKARHAAEYRLTAFRCDVTGAPPSKAFMRWRPEIEKPVRPQGQIGPMTGTDGAKTTPNLLSRSP